MIALGIGLLVNPLKTETLLLNFMGIFWLITGITLIVRSNAALGKQASLVFGLVGILAGMIVVGRNIVEAWLTDLVLLEVLGAVILLTGVAHVLAEFTIGRRTPARQTAYHYLLGIFEFVMGTILLLPALEPGQYVYWLATGWALVGGALILGQALLLRANFRLS